MTLEIMAVASSHDRTTIAVEKPTGEIFVFTILATDTGIDLSPVRLCASTISAPRVDRVGSDGFVDR